MSENLRDAMLALLLRLEWSGRGRPYDDGSHAWACPVCIQERQKGHTSGCELAACVRALAKEETQ